MNKRREDFELLQRFTRYGEQSAFADVARRHFDLVFATALRKVEDPGAAQEVAQNVFTVLARKAWQFAPDDSLPAWLHKTALLESKSWLRGELGRRRREQTAAELGTTMNAPENQPAFHALLPLLDEALLSLRERDRAALLLRFYESQSLREVGVAFGVSEDVAQKRVQVALEKLAQFFKRHGFKPATAALAVAALQQPGATASATVVSAVVAAALESAPALVGLAAWLARLASLSRAQTAAVCVALAAVPVGWQLKERHAAGEEAKQTHTQFLAAQGEHSALQAELERLRATSARWERSLAQAQDAAAAAAQSAQAFDAWKKKIRGQLAAADYRWPDDSPFVRIPKSTLPELNRLSDAEPFAAPGIVEPYARELLGLTSSERDSLEERLHRHFVDVESRMAAAIYETNTPTKDRFPEAAVATKVFILPELGDEAKQMKDQLVAELRSILGEERWPLVQARLDRTYITSNLGYILKLNSKAREELVSWVAPDDTGTLTANSNWNGPVAGWHRGALSMFLPEGDSNRTESAEKFGAPYLSAALRQRALAWLQEQAIARLGRGAGR